MLFQICQEFLVDETAILKGLIFSVILVLTKHRNCFVKMDCRHKEKLFQTLKLGEKSCWHLFLGSTAVFPEPGAHTMFPACLAAGRYGCWLEIIIFNNADHHKSSWEITPNITLGL